MTARRRLLAPLLAVALVLSALGGTSTARASAASGKVSFTQAQQQFNCTICHEPLYEARSDEAYEENALLRKLIARGDTLPQIKRTMVANYGIAVLANPPKHGFAVLIVVIPVAVIALGLLVIAWTIPRWRRRAARPHPTPPQISSEDAERLDADLGWQ